MTIQTITEYAEECAELACELEWGTEQQVEAENEFTESVRALVSAVTWSEYETYCLKATTQEIINEGLRLLGVDTFYNGYES